jgi:hypothetical protein
MRALPMPGFRVAKVGRIPASIHLITKDLQGSFHLQYIITGIVVMDAKFPLAMCQ